MQPCKHLAPGEWPFRIDLVLDAELSFTDALAHCTSCGATYVLELLDRRADQTLFRVSMPGQSASAGLLHSLSRGSCDLNRAGAEVQNLKSLQPYLPTLLLLDQQKPEIVDLVGAGDTRLPATPTRHLPCDGTWFERLRVPAS